jgi:simple sugar transport system permease protein
VDRAPAAESKQAKAAPSRRTSRSLFKIYLERPELAALVLLVIFIAMFQIRSQGSFLSVENLRGVLGLLPEVGMIGVGVTILMICGEFDLSVGSVFALAPMLMTILLNDGVSFWLAVPISLSAACLIGLINGLVTLRFGIPSFITTLGMMFMARSVTVVISGGFPPMIPDDAPAWIFTKFIGPASIFRLSFIWFLVVAMLASWLMASSNLGNWIKATGGHLEAAISMGIPTWRVKVFCFMLCAVLAGLAGIMQVLRLGSPLPSIGQGLELQAIAAAVIGGAALTGGIGTVLGAIVGALLIRVIDNGLIMTQVDANWFMFAIGFLTILAVIGNTWLRRMARKIKVSS